MDLLVAHNSGLHDYRLGTIIVDYENKEISLNLTSPQGNIDAWSTLHIKNYTYFSISNEIPWGEGIYIHASEILSCSDSTSQLEITLNSGDSIIIRYCNETVI